MTCKLPEDPKPPEVMNVPAVAKYFGCSRQAVHQAITRGRFPLKPFADMEGQALFLREQVERAHLILKND